MEAKWLIVAELLNGKSILTDQVIVSPTAKGAIRSLYNSFERFQVIVLDKYCEKVIPTSAVAYFTVTQI